MRACCLFILVCLMYVQVQAQAQIITTIAGNGIQGFGGDGVTATMTELFNPTGICVDTIGNIYIADYWNMRIRKVNISGIITTIAGDGIPSYSGDGGPATIAELFFPISICLDAAGSIYISDYNNYRVRKINSSGIISTVAGNGTNGFSGDDSAATAAQLFAPAGISTDNAGNLYIADVWNNRVRKVNVMGIITTIAGIGTAAYGGDGSAATAAKLNTPNSVYADAKGNVYVADVGNYRIRKIDTAGIISTFAGIGIQGYSGDGGPATAAQLFGATGLSMDASGDFFFSDVDNFVIRKISPTGIISTVAGNGFGAGTGFGGYSGDGGPPTSAELNFAGDVCVDATGNLYIADSDNNRIRKVSVSKTAVTTINNNDDVVKVYPYPASNTLYFQFPKGNVIIKLMDITGKLINDQLIFNSSTTTINVSGFNPGLYLYEVITSGITKSGKIIIEQ